MKKHLSRKQLTGMIRTAAQVTWINHNTMKIDNQTLHLAIDETYDWRKVDH